MVVKCLYLDMSYINDSFKLKMEGVMLNFFEKYIPSLAYDFVKAQYAISEN